MADDIIDLGDFLQRSADTEPHRGTMALWGADGERSRFTLPLWRIVHVARAERGIIFWQDSAGDMRPQPFIVLDVSHDPARLDVPGDRVDFPVDESSQLFDRGTDGILVRLGRSGGRTWGLLAEGRPEGPALTTREREDILFLAGECAGLLFLRSFADEAQE